MRTHRLFDKNKKIRTKKKRQKLIVLLPSNHGKTICDWFSKRNATKGGKTKCVEILYFLVKIKSKQKQTAWALFVFE